MRRGTTPTHTFNTDIDLSEASVIWLTYKQNGKVLFTKEISDMTITAESISVTLTQEETLMFETDRNVKIQIRARFSDGSAIASNVIQTSANAILKEGVI